MSDDEVSEDLASRIAGATRYSEVLPKPTTPPKPRRKSEKRVRRDELAPISEVLAEVAETRGWSKTMGLHQLLNDWADLVGPDIANHSEPESFTDGVLHVRTTSTAWATHLRYLVKDLLIKLNAQLGQGTVTKVVVKGPSAPRWSKGRRSVKGRGPRDTYG